jgi:hypothetical protein
MPWLTIPDAAVRVGRSRRTIYAWIEADALRKYDQVRGDRVVVVVREKALLEADRIMRSRRGRPRKNT